MILLLVLLLIVSRPNTQFAKLLNVTLLKAAGTTTTMTTTLSSRRAHHTKHTKSNIIRSRLSFSRECSRRGRNKRCSVCLLMMMGRDCLRMLIYCRNLSKCWYDDAVHAAQWMVLVVFVVVVVVLHFGFHRGGYRTKGNYTHHSGRCVCVTYTVAYN